MCVEPGREFFFIYHALPPTSGMSILQIVHGKMDFKKLYLGAPNKPMHFFVIRMFHILFEDFLVFCLMTKNGLLGIPFAVLNWNPAITTNHQSQGDRPGGQAWLKVPDSLLSSQHKLNVFG